MCSYRINDNNLAARVQDINLLNAFANETFDRLAAAMRPFVGKKITKAGGFRTAVFDVAIPDLPIKTEKGIPYVGYESGWSHTAAWKCYLWPGGEWTSSPICKTIYVGSISNHILTEILNRPRFKCDYNEDDVRDAMREIRDCEKKIGLLLGAIPDFRN